MRPTVTCGVKRVTILGAFTPVHRCRLRPSIPCAVFCQDIHIPLAPDDRRYAGMLIRYICVQCRGFVMRIWFGHRLCVIQHFLQEDHAYWFRDFSPQARQAKSTLLLIIHGISPYDPNLDVYRPSAIHGYTSGGSEPHHLSRIHRHTATHSVAYYTFLNGVVHFAQNIIAFIILASVSPVTYSIASLFKRVAVICIALVWFNQQVHPIQGVGIALTFLGLWMYNNAKGDIARGETRRRGIEASWDGTLPMTRSEERTLDATANIPPPPVYDRSTPEVGLAVSSARPPSPLRSKPLISLHANITAPPPRRGSISMLPPYPSPPASEDSLPLTDAVAVVSVRA